MFFIYKVLNFSLNVLLDSNMLPQIILNKHEGKYVINNISRLLYQFILKRRLCRNIISTISMTNKLHGLEFVKINSYLSLMPRKEAVPIDALENFILYEY